MNTPTPTQASKRSEITCALENVIAADRLLQKHHTHAAAEALVKALVAFDERVTRILEGAS